MSDHVTDIENLIDALGSPEGVTEENCLEVLVVTLRELGGRHHYALVDLQATIAHVIHHRELQDRHDLIEGQLCPLGDYRHSTTTPTSIEHMRSEAAGLLEELRRAGKIPEQSPVDAVQIDVGSGDRRSTTVAIPLYLQLWIEHGEELQVPQFKHDCDKCTFLASMGSHDFYYCSNSPTVIARYGDEGPEYLSGMELGKRAAMSDLADTKPLGMAYTLAKELGHECW
jgi:hypothetical protein